MQGDPRYWMLTRVACWFRRYVRRRTENKKTIFLVSGIFPRKADSVILLGFECTINPQYLMKIVRAIFEKMKILIFFLILTTLNFGGRSKTKKWAKDIFRGTLGIECEQDWSVGLGATLRDRQKIKNYFSSFKDFSGKSRQCHMTLSAFPGKIPEIGKIYFNFFPSPIAGPKPTQLSFKIDTLTPLANISGPCF